MTTDDGRDYTAELVTRLRASIATLEATEDRSAAQDQLLSDYRDHLAVATTDHA